MLRANYGLSRLEALDLPHWEFQQLVQAFHQQQARDTLSLYQAVGLAFGGKPKDTKQYVATLRKASGVVDKERAEAKKKKTSEIGSIFANLSGLGSVADYKNIAGG